MSYTVLARKFRSQSFDEVVGQKAVTTTLRNAIQQNRVHHGYLFCGTRGVGKTSMARILAKAMNCLAADQPTINPCGECDACQAIARGDDVDVIEIDAASNTGVDNIRELRSNAVYRPSRSRFKIYIIDEVHMLSTGAFNALLKTLEEPPDHVKFIFATTEAQKVPATILSRVQRFDFKSIPVDDIAGQLRSICDAEKVETEDAALRRLARLANGSMRDALSLLDQVLSMSGEKITAEILDEILPAPHDELFAALIDHLAASDAAGALGVLDQSLGQGQTLDHWCAMLGNQIRDLMMLRVCGAETELVDVPAGLRTQLVEQAQAFDSGAYVYMLSVLDELRRNVKSGGSGRALIEAAIIRLAEASNFSSIEELLARVNPDTAGSRPMPQRAPARPATAPRPVAKKKEPALAVSKPAPQGRGISKPKEATPPPPQATSKPAEKPAPMPPIGGRMSQADLRAAQAEPAVKAAMDLFGGQVIDVQRRPAVSSPAQEPHEDPDTAADGASPD